MMKNKRYFKKEQEATQKYEEFKEWFMTENFKAKKDHNWYCASALFREFEEDYKEEYRKREIMNIIWEAIAENTITIEYSIDGTQLHPAEAVYNKLKEKDIIK